MFTLQFVCSVISRSEIRLSLFVMQIFVVAAVANAETDWRAGFSRIDVTPTEPVRMSGYGNRDHPSEGIDTPLFVRGLALQHVSSDQPPLILLTIDTIGIPGEMTRSVTESIEQKHSIPRERIVICSTHTHCGPDLASQLSNIFSIPLTENELAAAKRYDSLLLAGILKAVDVAIDEMSPASLAYEVGEATFAVNRRVITNGRWTGFGIQPDGPVDHTVPVLRIKDDEEKLLGVIFNYACHGTTLGGDHYKINAEWCGYACDHLESKHAGAIAMCTIGCGADANPNPRGTMDAAKIHGRTLAAEVERLINRPMKAVDQSVVPAFDFAALSFDLPTEDELQNLLKDQKPQTRRHAENLLNVYQRDGRLPATYPVPIQSWKFGDQLNMIFIGGEVVVDYAIRLKKRIGDPKLWVTAYANDVLGYIASERVRNEGGYEFDRSAVYYGLPGPWATGTEDLLIERIEALRTAQKQSRPLSADEAFALDQGARGNANRVGCRRADRARSDQYRFWRGRKTMGRRDG